MARRMRGEGSVYERKDGYWVAQYKGRYRYAKSKKEAKKKLVELIKAGEVHKPVSDITVAVFMDRWLTPYVQALRCIFSTQQRSADNRRGSILGA